MVHSCSSHLAAAWWAAWQGPDMIMRVCVCVCVCVCVQNMVNKTKQMDTWKPDSCTANCILSVFRLPLHEKSPFFSSQMKDRQLNALWKKKLILKQQAKAQKNNKKKSNRFYLKGITTNVRYRYVSVLLVKRSANIEKKTRTQNIRILIIWFLMLILIHVTA